MLLTKEVEITWTGRKAEEFISKGYIKNPGDKTFKCKVEHLPTNSHVRIDVKCDTCGTIMNRRYAEHIKARKIKDFDTCGECALEIHHENHPQRLTKDDIASVFKSKGYTYIENGKYRCVLSKVDYICDKHPDAGIQQTSYANVKQSMYPCKTYFHEATSGENSWLWKGGITELNTHLRQTILPWVWDSYKQGDNICILTGSKDIEVHHKTSFNLIVRETLDYLKLPIKPNIGDYTQQEITDIDNKCLQLHIDYGLGVCLDKTLHTLFHSLYGRGDNTPEQFEEFIQRYKSGELEVN